MRHPPQQIRLIHGPLAQPDKQIEYIEKPDLDVRLSSFPQFTYRHLDSICPDHLCQNLYVDPYECLIFELGPAVFDHAECRVTAGWILERRWLSAGMLDCEQEQKRVRRLGCGFKWKVS
jgi:hypothetical protein